MSKMYGRQCVGSQINDNINVEFEKVPAMKNGICQRCNQASQAFLPNKERYCRNCIGLGRICENDYLYRNQNSKKYDSLPNGGLTWRGKLTEAQEKVSRELIQSFVDKKDHLVHAVTGAGKTEMLFGVIKECLKQGKRVAIATPRIDVVDELYPRFCEAFACAEIGKYHGREFHEPDDEQFIICTTHQLLKFYRAFDLLVIDEVDSFPFHEDPVLHFGAQQAAKVSGSRFYLTATPDENLLKRAKSHKIGYSLLNRRFHGGLLPVPKNQFYLRPFINKNKLHPKLKAQVEKIIKTKKPLLVFIPRVAQLPAYHQIFKKNFSDLKIDSVHAADKKRQEKVLRFRNQELDILLTTTILERGVTFKSVQVIVVAADDGIYNTPSLVQIAGRVGRNKNDRSGLVLFCYHHYTKSLREANYQIRKMNR